MTQHRIASTITALLLAAAACPAVAQQAAAAPNFYKIGYVDTERVMRDSRASRQVKKGLDEEYLRRAKELVGAAPGDLERRKAALVDEMNSKREFAQQQFVGKAKDILLRVAEAEKYDAVFLEASYASTRIDLTDRIIRALDSAR